MTDHPRLPGRLWDRGEHLADVPAAWPVVATRRPFDGGFVSVREDTVTEPSGGALDRLVVEHKGAVGVLALDAEDRVLLIRQYRHAAQAELLELPAGILDVGGEAPQTAAARELAEETDVLASTWRELGRIWPSPGMTDEHWVIYEAADLEPAEPGSSPERVHEEAYLEVWWVPLPEVVGMVLDGRIADAMTTVGVLTLWARRQRA